ncbi:uncharacterized protein LOC135077870 [Ostrinia nubilalis]|uniref:uncharacterized protein LOC114366409 n=1 Tax=Ostrinia furnacalis TaxID=93504 RepID=UPI001039BFAC|nr:uncharacterized protein LOC114366409 [Ostrinia furnacalis]
MFRGLWSPRTDVTEFTRCCFCLPLRHGLIAWGYLKTVLLSVLIFEQFLEQSYREKIAPMWVITTAVTIIDLIWTAVFILAGHMKHRLLFKLYYKYSVCFLVIFIVVFLANTIDDIIEIETGRDRGGDVTYLVYYLSYFLLGAIPMIALHGYVTLLVRSELLKLDRASIQFVNKVNDGNSPMCLEDEDHHSTTSKEVY